MRYDEGIESELNDWLLSAGEFSQLIAPRLVKEAVRAIQYAQRAGLLDDNIPTRPPITVQEYL